MEIRDVDLTVEAQLREWYDVWAAAQRQRPEVLVDSWEVCHALATPHPSFAYELFEVRRDGQPAGAGLVNLPQDDNLTVAYADAMVHPDHRRRGVGTAVVDEIERRARAGGRSRVLIEVFDLPGGDGSGVAFAEARGYSVANREAMKAVDLAASEPTWAALDDEVAAHRGTYRVLTWRDRCPDDLVAGFAAALSRIMSLVPQGDLDLEDTDFTVDRIRALEERRLTVGQATFESAAVAPDGTVAGLTGVRVSLPDPRVAHVSVTMVLPGHRGHRLGLAVKLAGHRALRAELPECQAVVTSNADVNQHMNAINEALGYRQLETLLEYHRTL
ncbi:MAG: GNAT family N-acetyltransferase [Nocardioides sp.]